MAISEDMRDLVCKFGNAKMHQGAINQASAHDSFWAQEESRLTFEKLCYEIEELERYANNWHEHRCY